LERRRLDRGGGGGVDEHVAYGADGADETGGLGVVAELATEGPDVDIDGTVDAVVKALAEGLDQLLAGFDAAAGAGEGEEEIELEGGELEGQIVEGGEVGGGIDAEGTDDEIGLGLAGGRGGGAGIAPDDGAEAGEELAGGECLGEIIIGAHLEADDTVGLIAPGGEHEDGDLGTGADAHEDLEAIDAREHHIENDGVEGLREGALDARKAVVLCLDVVAEGLEVIGNESAELAFIIDDEDAGGGGGRAVHGLRGIWGYCAPGGPGRV